MKKKFTIGFLVFLCLICAAFSLSACSLFQQQSPPSIQQYKVSIETTRGGEATELHGNYEVGEQVDVSAKTYLGYDWCGWYNGDTLLSTDLNYTITMPAADTKYTAKWTVKSEMQMFEFYATTQKCVIVSLTDKNLTEVHIPNYVTSIEQRAFFWCNRLEKICVDNENANYSSQDGILYNKNKTELYHVPKAIKGDITIAENVTEIFEEAFANRDSLTSITIPEKIHTIGNNAFSSCDSLTQVNWNATYCSFTWPYGPDCGIFYKCVNLQSVIIGENVKSIPGNTFHSCSGLTSIILPEKISMIGGSAFVGCSNLTKVYWNILKPDECDLKGCENLKTIIIGENVTIIPDYFCSGNNALTNVILGNNVTSIGYGAFQNCSEITNITIPKSVTTIGAYSFNGCNLISIDFEGTKEEWNTIKKGSGWDMRTGNYVVHCTNGDIKKQ